MKRLILFCLMALSLQFSIASNDPYSIDDTKVDALFAQADDISASAFSMAAVPSAAFSLQPQQTVGEKDPVVAWLICTFLGEIGVHRLYLGTKTTTFILYLCTAGGLGCVAGIDWWMLLINGLIEKDISKYVDNPKFIMWLD